MSTVTDVHELGPAVQDYLKAVHHLGEGSAEPVTTTALAQRLALTAGSVSAMVRRLADDGLLEHAPYRGVRLTDDGERVALELVRHHRLLEAFLVDLGMPWDRVHAEAEILEHHISEELEALIAARLGHPTRDPHGDPIPTSELEMPSVGTTTALAELTPGGRTRFVRIADDDPAMLRHLAERGIAPGDELELVAVHPFGGPYVVRAAGEEHQLGVQLAGRMRCAGPHDEASR